MRMAATLLLFLASCSIAQSKATLQIKLATPKDTYVLNEAVMVQAELTNVSDHRICFPRPEQDCELPERGSLIVTSRPEADSDWDTFICHADGRGIVGRELDDAIKNDWIKLEPGKTFVAPAEKAQLNLSTLGTWTITAKYNPPEGGFSTRYRTILQDAAKKAGCSLPEETVVATTLTITVKAVPSTGTN